MFVNSKPSTKTSAGRFAKLYVKSDVEPLSKPMGFRSHFDEIPWLG